MKIAVTGATGLIGKKITDRLISRGDEVWILSRSESNSKKIFPGAQKHILWDYKKKDWFSKLEGCDAIIHLAGENVMGKRWNAVHKKNIMESRVLGTRSLIDAVYNLQEKPKAFICASASGFYGNREEQVDEFSKPGSGFLAEVVNAWEEEAAKIEFLKIRRVSIRTGIVLDKNEGALEKMLLPFKYFIGGPIGSGMQWFPWIHIEDVIELFLFALDNNSVKGDFNAVSTQQIRMNEFTAALGKVLNRPSFFRVPAFVLKLVIGEAAEVVLGGANIYPKRTLEAGFKFKFTEIESALRDIFK